MIYVPPFCDVCRAATNNIDQKKLCLTLVVCGWISVLISVQCEDAKNMSVDMEGE